MSYHLIRAFRASSNLPSWKPLVNWSANWSLVLIEITSILSDLALDQKKCYCRAIGLVRVDIFDIVETLVQFFYLRIPLIYEYHRG